MGNIKVSISVFAPPRSVIRDLLFAASKQITPVTVWDNLSDPQSLLIYVIVIFILEI